jgi:hypothetical protein
VETRSTRRVRVSNSLLADVVVQFIPWDREILRLASEGEWPWTNRWAGDGGPLFANPQTALFAVHMAAHAPPGSTAGR